MVSHNVCIKQNLRLLQRDLSKNVSHVVIDTKRAPSVTCKFLLLSISPYEPRPTGCKVFTLAFK